MQRTLGAVVEVAGEQHADRVALVHPRVLEDLDAVVVGHLQIRDHDVVLAGAASASNAAVPEPDRFDTVGIAELVDERVADVVVVIDDKDAC